MIIRGNSDEYVVSICEGESIDWYMDKIAGALILEGFAIQTIIDGFESKLKEFKEEG